MKTTRTVTLKSSFSPEHTNVDMVPVTVFHVMLNFYLSHGRTIQQIEISTMSNLVPHHHKSDRTEHLTGENCHWFFVTWPNKSSPYAFPSLHLIILFLRPRLKPLPQWPNSDPFSPSPPSEMLFLSNLPMPLFLFSLNELWVTSGVICHAGNLHHHLTLILSNQDEAPADLHTEPWSAAMMPKKQMKKRRSQPVAAWKGKSSQAFW